MPELIFYSVSIGLWAWVYTMKLTDPEEIFDFVPPVVDKFNKIITKNKGWFSNAIERWGYKCGACHGGLFGFVAYPLLFNYVLFDHFSFVVIVMTVAYFLEILTVKLKE